MDYVCGRRQQSPSQQHMGTAVRTATTSPAFWDAFADVDAFVDEVLNRVYLEKRSFSSSGSR